MIKSGPRSATRQWSASFLLKLWPRFARVLLVWYKGAPHYIFWPHLASQIYTVIQINSDLFYISILDLIKFDVCSADIQMLKLYHVYNTYSWCAKFPLFPIISMIHHILPVFYRRFFVWSAREMVWRTCRGSWHGWFQGVSVVVKHGETSHISTWRWWNMDEFLKGIPATLPTPKPKKLPTIRGLIRDYYITTKFPLIRPYEPYYSWREVIFHFQNLNL